MDDKKRVRITAIIVVIIFTLLLISVLLFRDTAKQNYMDVSKLKSNFHIVNAEGKADEVGRVVFKEEDRKVSLDKYLSVTEKEFIDSYIETPKGVERSESFGNIIYEYSSMTFGKDFECNVDDDYSGSTFDDCFSRVSQLIANSNTEYIPYIDSGIEDLDKFIDKKIGLIENMKEKTYKRDSDVGTAVDYLYRLNLTYKENIEELKELKGNIGDISMEEMDEEVTAINNSYQTNDNNFELRLVRYINNYKDLEKNRG